MSSQESRINDLLERLQTENLGARPQQIPGLPSGPLRAGSRRPNRPNLQMDSLSNSDSPRMRRPRELPFSPRPNNNIETDKKLKEIMKISGKLTIRGLTYMTDIKDLEHIEELGNGTCGHVVKMMHEPSKEIIAVKQMRRSGNSEENKRIIMDIEVVIKSHDCSYIVQCLGCFITDAEVWICMELMSTCFDKLLKRVKQAIPEHVIGKVTVATVKALSYLKEKHGVMHRDVKPSNILLDERGNIKLCDFGISGRLVDSMAKTRSAGCAAYMAPERIEPDPNNPDYDIRADVWSLGITLVELATGEYPYQDCKTDFEVLTKVLEQDPPVLPENKHFSPDFRQFVGLCLTKDPEQRPKYNRLQNEPFIRKYETENVNVGEWFQEALLQADQLASTRVLPRRTTSPLMPGHCQNSSNQSPLLLNQTTFMNGSPRTPPSPQVLNNSYSTKLFKPLESQIKITYQSTANSLPPDGRSYHTSRYSAFHNTSHGHTGHQRDTSSLYQSIQPEKLQPFNQSRSPPVTNVRGFSPFRVYNCNYSQEGESKYLPLSQHCETVQSTTKSPYLQRRIPIDVRRNSPIGSPLLGRNQNSEEHIYGNTSPIVLQRFYHQQKQHQKAQEAEEAAKEDPGKRRFASYIKLQLSADRSGRLSRHQSPEPPPRLNRSSDSHSPLATRQHYLDSNASPSLPRRYISPSPPIPPPRRLSESISVPGSPQHLRTRFHYTPEPQRRLYHNNDISS